MALNSPETLELISKWPIADPELKTRFLAPYSFNSSVQLYNKLKDEDLEIRVIKGPGYYSFDKRGPAFSKVLAANNAHTTPFRKNIIFPLIKARLAQLRTQLRVNTSIGVADRLLNKWECGSKSPSPFLLDCWARTVHCDLIVTPSDAQHVCDGELTYNQCKTSNRHLSRTYK